jgi:hypothetical protein
MGMLASLGRRTAVGEVFGHQFSGIGAWLLWRTVYLAKLPGWDRRARVGLDWALDFVFPPDIVSATGALPVSTGTSAAQGTSRAAASTAPSDSATGQASESGAAMPPSIDRPPSSG